MTTTQENKLAMYQTVERYLLTHAAVVATLPHYTASFAAFGECLRQIQGYKQTQETNKGGLTEQKQQRRTEVINLALDVANKLKAYATFTKQTVLLREIDYRHSDLKLPAANVLADRVRIVYQKARENEKALLEYRVTAELLDALQAALTRFEDSITEPRMGTVTRKNATDGLQNCYREIDRVLKEQLNVIIEMVRSSEPAFFSGYQNARVIVDRKGSRTSGGKEEVPPQAA